MVDTLVLETSTVTVWKFESSPGHHFQIFLYFCSVSSGQVKQRLMKQGIHPVSKKVKVICSCGNTTELLSTIKGEEIRVEICSKCHPHYTGEQKILKTGAVDKFYARQKKMEELQAAKK